MWLDEGTGARSGGRTVLSTVDGSVTGGQEASGRDEGSRHNRLLMINQHAHCRLQLSFALLCAGTPGMSERTAGTRATARSARCRGLVVSMCRLSPSAHLLNQGSRIANRLKLISPPQTFTLKLAPSPMHLTTPKLAPWSRSQTRCLTLTRWARCHTIKWVHSRNIIIRRGAVK